MSTSAPPPLLASFDKPVPDDSSRPLTVYHPVRQSAFFDISVRTCPLPGNRVSEKPCVPTIALLDACRIVTGRDGALARDAAGQQLVSGGLAEHGVYYYIVDGNPALDYPIFYSFNDWVPPRREEIADRWFTPNCPRIRARQAAARLPWFALTGNSADTLGSKAKQLDGACRLSAFEVPVDAAHIVPDSEATWYTARRVVSQLSPNYSVPRTLPPQNGVHDVRNFITLRTDIRTRWDGHAFVFIPVDGHFIAYYFSDATERQAAEFHCARLHTPERTDGYLLYLRFALTVFSYVPSPWLMPRHPDSSPVVKSPRSSSTAPSEVSEPSHVPVTLVQGERSAATGHLDRVETTEPSDVLMDDVTAAKHIIDWYSNVEREDLPEDLAYVWRDLIDHKADAELDIQQLRREWQQRQEQLREHLALQPSEQDV